MSKVKNIAGNKFGMLTVIEKSKSINGKAYWLCKCDCGNETIVSGSNLRTGAVKSCGCLIYKKKDTHHLSHTRLFRIWWGIKNRCDNPKSEAYKYYGKKGIHICDEWANDFVSFYNWAMLNGYDDGLSIDRIDNSKGYSPDNCRFTTKKVQANNRSYCKFYEYNGKTQTLTQWCEELNLNYKLVHGRIYRCGWSFEKAITQPAQNHTRKE